MHEYCTDSGNGRLSFVHIQFNVSSVTIDAKMNIQKQKFDLKTMFYILYVSAKRNFHFEDVRKMLSTFYFSKLTAKNLIANSSINIARILEVKAFFRIHTISYQ